MENLNDLNHENETLLTYNVCGQTSDGLEKVKFEGSNRRFINASKHKLRKYMTRKKSYQS